MEQQVQDLKTISSWVANDISHIQGAGGNSSVKTADGKLLIKASGKNMQQLIVDNAYVVLDNTLVKNILIDENFDITNNDAIATAIQTIKETVIEKKNIHWQPSMEVGFHTLFYTYTLHTHNAWTNILLCSSHFELIEDLFVDADYELSTLGDYYTPGIPLSWHIYNSYRFEEGMPNVLFLPNHGIIYSHNSLEKLKAIIADVEEKILYLLKAKATDYPTYTITENAEGIAVDCTFLLDNLYKKENSILFTELLFPDQAIYINKNDFSFTSEERLFTIDIENRQIKSKANKIQTMAVIETAIAFYFIWNEIEKREYEALTINWEWEQLTQMPTEQHRINMLNN